MANCYLERAKNGFFVILKDQLRAIDPTSTFALGAMTYGLDFSSVYFPPDKEGGFGRTLFYRKDEDGNRGDELGLVLFGEVCHSAYGTQISAKGNHSLGRVPKPITDDTVIKDVLVLRPLTGTHLESSNNFLEDAFTNQVMTLQEIITEARRSADLHPTTKSALVTSWLVPSDPHAETKDNGLIKVTLPPKYKVKGEVPQKKNLLAPPTTPTIQKGDVSDSDTLSDSSVDGADGPEIKLGALYDPNLLPDHRGRYFEHRHAKLVQNDFVDIDENLIAPWDMADKLREGTVVLVEATLVCWHISDKKIYQIQGHRLRVLGESDETPEVFDIPELPPKPSFANFASQIAPSSPRKKASAAFSSFSSPSKRPRLD